MQEEVMLKVPRPREHYLIGFIEAVEGLLPPLPPLFQGLLRGLLEGLSRLDALDVVISWRLWFPNTM